MRRLALLLLLTLPGLAGCGALWADVSGEEARELVDQGALLVDVRTPEEFARGHIEGAVNVPMGHLERRVPRLAEPERPVVIYCENGNRSLRAKATLERVGFESVHNMGPIRAW